MRPCNFFLQGACTNRHVEVGGTCHVGSHHPAFLLKTPQDQRWKSDKKLLQWALSLPEWTREWDKHRTMVYDNARRLVMKKSEDHEWHQLAVHSARQKRAKEYEAKQEEERRRARQEREKRNRYLKKKSAKAKKAAFMVKQSASACSLFGLL